MIAEDLTSNNHFSFNMYSSDIFSKPDPYNVCNKKQIVIMTFIS